MKTGPIDHRRGTILAFLFTVGAALFCFSAWAQQDAFSNGETAEGARVETSRNATILTLNGPVTPPTADYLEREIKAASDAGDELIVLEIDTPGGLVDSMKVIIKAILASETPVASYVSPQGARSASAGLYIMYASHISAMAPFTNTGAATPVEVGGGPSRDNPFEGDQPSFQPDPKIQPAPKPGDVEETSKDVSTGEDNSEAELPEVPVRDGERVAPISNEDALRAKIINDSVAYIRALAEERGRNADWAEDAVREGVSVTHKEALELGVIDFIADDLDDLFEQINGQSIDTVVGPKELFTNNLVLKRVEPTFVERLLAFIANPNVAVILMSLATTGIVIEMWNPGAIFPGAIGVLSFMLGLYSFSVLPYTWLGSGLMLLGAFLILIEAFTPLFGLAGLTGVAILGAGMYTVFPDEFRVSTSLIMTVLAVTGGFLLLILIALVGSRNHGPLIGAEAIKRREGIVDDWNGKEGWVIVEGERWRARSDKPLSPGDRVRVIEMDGLVLVVRQARALNLLSGIMPGEANKA
ncbi:MAG: nodulation protein NfeD [Pseudomonadota bacterium]